MLSTLVFLVVVVGGGTALRMFFSTHMFLQVQLFPQLPVLSCNSSWFFEAHTCMHMGDSFIPISVVNSAFLVMQKIPQQATV
jgi:hypothetical protein